MSDCESGCYPVFFVAFVDDVGIECWGFLFFVGRQSVMPDRNGLCSIVSRVGAFESMVII